MTPLKGLARLSGSGREMSLRALEFVDDWIALFVRAEHGIDAAPCYGAAAERGISPQEIEKDGDLTTVIAGYLGVALKPA